MPLNRRKLQSDLEGSFGNGDHLTGIKLAMCLSNFSKGILPPTIGVVTGIGPATAAYDSAPFPPNQGKTIGMENAINQFSQFNATGITQLTSGIFIGIPAPPIRNLQKIFDFVRDNNETKEFLCKLLSTAIFVNYSLGKSTFTISPPGPITIPTWNIPVIPFGIRSAIEEEDIDLNEEIRKNKAEYLAKVNEQISLPGGPDGPDGIPGTLDDPLDRLLDFDYFFDGSLD